MTGTLEHSAKISSLLCLSVLRALLSTSLESTLEVSSIGSPLPSCESELFKNIEDPPIWVMATSNAARVLVEDFSKTNPNVFTKSGIMVGLGENKQEVIQVMDDLRSAEVDFITIGQYLQPSPKHHPLNPAYFLRKVYKHLYLQSFLNPSDLF